MRNLVQSSTSRVCAAGIPFFLFSGGNGFLTPAVAKMINLTIFILAGYFLLRKPAREFFAARLAGVREVLQRAAIEKEAATRQMAELDARLNRLGEELAAIQTRTAEEAAAERQRIEAETERDVTRLREMARREIESARQVALNDLRSFAAHQAVEMAEQLIRHELRPDDDARLIKRVGEELARVN